MKSADEIRKAELRGYSRGYQTGSTKKKNDRAAQNKKQQHDAKWNRAFLAALPAALVMNGWKIGEKPISTIEERLDFAVRIANRSAERMR